MTRRRVLVMSAVVVEADDVEIIVIDTPPKACKKQMSSPSMASDVTTFAFSPETKEIMAREIRMAGEQTPPKRRMPDWDAAF